MVLKYVGTYSTAGGQIGVVFTVGGLPRRLFVFVGADQSILQAWLADGWTRNIAVWNLSRTVGPAYPAKSTWGGIMWRQWGEVGPYNMAAFRWARAAGYSV